MRSKNRRRRKHLVAGASGFSLAWVAWNLLRSRGRDRARPALAGRPTATARKGWRRLGRARRRFQASLRGRTQKVVHEHRGDRLLDDRTLVDKVQTELFGDPDVPKGRLNVEARDGVITLRGQVERPRQIAEIERRTRGINGVRGVVNLLHLPGVPAPNKSAVMGG